MPEGELPPIVVEFIARDSSFRAAMGSAQESISEFQDGSSSKLQAAQAVGKTALLGIAGAALAVGVSSVKMAGDYQESLTQLVTGAGESERNINKVGQGMLDMAGQVGISAGDLSKGMYLIESAGQHGSNGLLVLKAAAEGARVGGADLTSVADGLTTALTDYSIPAKRAATVTSELVATVAAGKTHMADLSSSLAMVLPAASAAGVGLTQVLGAMATMTAQGTKARLAAMYLRGTILSLSNPTQLQTTEMSQLGVSSLDVAKNLGERGLTGTFDILTNAIASHSAAGLVTIDILKKAAASGKTLSQATAGMTTEQQTNVASLAKMLGSTRNLQAALELTGAHAKTFSDNIRAIGEANTDASGNVRGFSLTQKDLNTQMANLKAGVGALMIELGQKLIPILEQATAFFLSHKEVLIAVAAVIGTVVVAAITTYVAHLAVMAAESLVQFAQMAASAATWAAEMLVSGAEALLPFLPIILTLAAVAAAGYLLVTHWKEIWGAISSVVVDAWHFIEDAFRIAISLIMGIWNGFMGFFTALPGEIEHVATGMWNGIIDAFRSAINFVVRIWDDFSSHTKFTLPSINLGFMHIGGEHIGPLLPQLPYLASGGDITQGGMARVGEHGVENVFLPTGAKVQPIPRSGGGGSGGGTIVVEVPVYLDSRVIAKVVTPAVRDNMIQAGRGMPNIFGGTA